MMYHWDYSSLQSCNGYIYAWAKNSTKILFSSLDPVYADSSNGDQEDHTVAQAWSFLEEFVYAQGSRTQV